MAAKKKVSVAPPEEQKERIDTMRTQGRAGCALPRINLAFRGDNYDFVRTMARLKGKSATEYVNDLLAYCRTEHPDAAIYQAALDLIAQAEGTKE